MPFDELDQGDAGHIKDLLALFGLKNKAQYLSMLDLASRPKREANRMSCACGSGKRLGICHHRKINQLRKKCGRLAFRSMLLQLSK